MFLPCNRNERPPTQIYIIIRGGSRAVANSKMERFVKIVYGFQPLTIITKRSILDVAVALDPSLITSFFTETVASNFPLVLINKTSKMISYYYILLDKQLLCS